MKLSRLLWLICAFIALGAGTLGIFLPILPTVPLYLLTAFCFANSSSRLHDWFLRSGLYRRHLLPYLEAGGLTFKAKLSLILFVTLQLAIAAVIVRNSLVGLLIVAGVYIGFMASMLFAVKTVKLGEQPDPLLERKCSNKRKI